MADKAFGEGPYTLSLAFSLMSEGEDCSGVLLVCGPAARAGSVTRSKNRSIGGVGRLLRALCPGSVRPRYATDQPLWWGVCGIRPAARRARVAHTSRA